MFAQEISGMAWVLFLIVGGGAGLLIGVVGIFIRLAVRDAYLVLAAGMIFCTLCLCLPFFFVLLIFTNPFVGEGYLWLTLPLLIGLPTLLLSRLPALCRRLSDRRLPAQRVEDEPGREQAWIEGGNLRIKLALALGAAVIGMSCYLAQLRTCRGLERLLTGEEPDVEVASVRFGRNPGLLLNDAESAHYLTTAFRSAVNEGYYPAHHHRVQGPSYILKVSMVSKGSAEIHCEVDEREDGFLLNFFPTAFDDPLYYWIRLPEPRPTAVTEALRKLRR